MAAQTVPVECKKGSPTSANEVVPIQTKGDVTMVRGMDGRRMHGVNDGRLHPDADRAL